MKKSNQIQTNDQLSDDDKIKLIELLLLIVDDANLDLNNLNINKYITNDLYYFKNISCDIIDWFISYVEQSLGDSNAAMTILFGLVVYMREKRFISKKHKNHLKRLIVIRLRKKKIVAIKNEIKQLQLKKNVDNKREINKATRLKRAQKKELELEGLTNWQIKLREKQLRTKYIKRKLQKVHNDTVFLFNTLEKLSVHFDKITFNDIYQIAYTHKIFKSKKEKWKMIITQLEKLGWKFQDNYFIKI